MGKIIVDQLSKRSKTKIKHISYYESVPLKQIHIYTFFYNNDILYYQYLFLMIVDIAIKYINIVPQMRKNESIVPHLDNLRKEVQSEFPTAVKESNKSP